MIERISISVNNLRQAYSFNAANLVILHVNLEHIQTTNTITLIQQQYPMSEIRRIAVLTSGGDAPGMNAAIRAVTRAALYNDIIVYGVKRGYAGLINGDLFRIDSQFVGNIIHRGGTILKTARSMEFMKPEGRKIAYEQLKAYDIDAVVAIGGNGTLTGAQVFTSEYPDIPFMGAPGTIDNDLYGSDLTIGYDTALNTAVEAVDRIRDTADSHDRLFFIEVMGRDSGFIALNSGIAGGSTVAMIPEKDISVEDVIETLERGRKRKKLFSLVIVAEGNKSGNAYELAEAINKKYSQYETKVSVIGHLQRGGNPTCLDRVLASQLGAAAVDGLMAGEFNKMAGIINNEIVYTPFDDAINKEKPLDKKLMKLAEILAI